MNPGKFYEDAEECLRLADRATARTTTRLYW